MIMADHYRKEPTGVIVTFMADLDWVKFFIPRFSFGTHDRHSRLNPTADLNSRGSTQAYSEQDLA